MADDLSDTIASRAVDPKAGKVDGREIQERSLAELIEADKYLGAKAAAARTNGPRVIFQKMSPPGAS